MNGDFIRSGLMIIFATIISFRFIKIMQPLGNIPKKDPENKDLPENPLQLYEVLRVIDGIPLFLEDHLERLYNSVNLLRIENAPNKGFIEECILNLISTKNQQFGNRGTRRN